MHNDLDINQNFLLSGVSNSACSAFKKNMLLRKMTANEPLIFINGIDNNDDLANIREMVSATNRVDEFIMITDKKQILGLSKDNISRFIKSNNIVYIQLYRFDDDPQIIKDQILAILVAIKDELTTNLRDSRNLTIFTHDCIDLFEYEPISNILNPMYAYGIKTGLFFCHSSYNDLMAMRKTVIDDVILGNTHTKIIFKQLPEISKKISEYIGKCPENLFSELDLDQYTIVLRGVLFKDVFKI